MVKLEKNRVIHGVTAYLRNELQYTSGIAEYQESQYPNTTQVSW